MLPSIEDFPAVPASVPLTDSVQAIFFPRDFEDSAYRLLELPPELADRLSVQQNFLIRGLDDDPAALCTQDSTFTLKELQVSNTLLLVSDVNCDHDVMPAVPEGEASTSAFLAVSI